MPKTKADHDYLEGGLRRKYEIRKADGSPTDPDAVYFILRLDEDPHARKAALAYAESIREENPELAEELEYLCTHAESAGLKAFTDKWQRERGFLPPTCYKIHEEFVAAYSEEEALQAYNAMVVEAREKAALSDVTEVPSDVAFRNEDGVHMMVGDLMRRLQHEAIPCYVGSTYE